MTKNAERLYDAKLKEIQIPERIGLKSEFIQNADHSIYPQCFQYFVHTKCILNDSFIKDFVRLIEKPFFPLLESFIRGFVATDSTVSDDPVSVLNQGVFDSKLRNSWILSKILKFSSKLRKNWKSNMNYLKLRVKLLEKICLSKMKLVFQLL